MSQKVHFHFAGKRYVAKPPFEGAEHAVVEALTCPKCKASPLKVAGVKGTMHHTHDQYIADAGCIECGTVFGQLIITVNTIFGIEEDERVLNGRCRVY